MLPGILGNWGSSNNTGSGLMAYHYYGALPASFQVNATAQNIWGCQADETQMVNISSNTLTGEILASGPLSFCSGQSVSLSAPLGGATYLWSNGMSGQSITIGTEGI